MRPLVVTAEETGFDEAYCFATYRVYASDGRVLAQGAVAPGAKAEVIYAEEQTPATVQGVSAFGLEARTVVERGEAGLDTAHLVFKHDWSLLFTDSGTTALKLNSQGTPDSLWLLFWRKETGTWTPFRPPSVDVWGWGVVVDLRESTIVQFGGAATRWQLVRLPQGQFSLHFGAVTPFFGQFHLIVRTTPAVDVLSSLLRRGAVEDMEILLSASNTWPVLLAEHGDSEVQAILGFCQQRLKPEAWWYVTSISKQIGNYRAFNPRVLPVDLLVWLASEEPGRLFLRETLEMVDAVVEGGYPVLSEGARIFSRTLKRLGRAGPPDKNDGAFSVQREALGKYQRFEVGLRALLSASLPGSAFFSFFGASPVRPSLRPIIGLPENPRMVPVDPGSKLLPVPGETMQSFSNSPDRSFDWARERIRFVSETNEGDLHAIAEEIENSGHVVRLI